MDDKRWLNGELVSKGEFEKISEDIAKRAKAGEFSARYAKLPVHRHVHQMFGFK